MAVHTYIGARYVPRFVGTYDPTQQYEALDVVDNGSGTSYISRQGVPAGTPLTDTDYWFVYGASSGAIIALQNDMIAAQGDIITLQGDMTSAQGDITNLQGNVTQLTKYTTLQRRKFLLIGDSYTVSGQPYTPWGDLFESYSGATCVKRPDDGGGFVASGLYGTFGAVLTAEPADNTITDIIVCGGANDNTAHNASATPAAVKSAVATFCSDAKTKFPNARIYIAFVGGSKQLSYFAPLSLARNAYKTGANENGACFIDLYYVLKQSDLFTDYLHPTTAGMKELVYGLIDNVTGGTFNYSKSGTVTATANSSITGAFEATPSLFLNQDNGNIQFMATDMIRMTCSTSVSNSWLKLFDIDPYPCGPNRLLGVTQAALTSNGTPVETTVSWALLNNEFYIRSIGSNANVTRILLSPFCSNSFL